MWDENTDAYIREVLKVVCIKDGKDGKESRGEERQRKRDVCVCMCDTAKEEICVVVGDRRGRYMYRYCTTRLGSIRKTTPSYWIQAQYCSSSSSTGTGSPLDLIAKVANLR